MQKHSCVKTPCFMCITVTLVFFSHVSADTPAVFVANEGSESVFVLEVARTLTRA